MRNTDAADIPEEIQLSELVDQGPALEEAQLKSHLEVFPEGRFVAVERDGPSAMSAGGWKLSFQSKRGFESLGYAAAIEWINERAGRFEGYKPRRNSIAGPAS